MLYAFDEFSDREIIPRMGARGSVGDPATIVNPPPRSIIDESAEFAIKSVSYNAKDYARMLAAVKSSTGAWKLTTAGECASKAGSKAATITDFISTPANFIPVVGWITSGALSIFGTFRKKHAAAVAREKSVLCAAATESNKILADLDNLYRSGQITGAQAVAVLDLLVSEFRKAIVPIAKRGNASQWKLAQLIALVEHRKRFEYRTEQPLGSPANPWPTKAPQKAPLVPGPGPSGKSTLAVAGLGTALLWGILTLG